MCMDQITNRLPGIIAIQDDICVFGKTRDEHDTHLLQLMKTASKNGLVFNSHKCSIKQPKLHFMENFHCTRDESRPSENSSFTRPPYP